MDGEGEREREREGMASAAQCSNLNFKTKHRYSDFYIHLACGLFCLVFHTSPCLCSYLCIRTSCTCFDTFFLCIFPYFPEVVVLYMNRRRVQIPLALQCCSNGKCAYARRSHPEGFTFSTTALSGQQSHKKKWNNIMKTVIAK